MDSGVTAVSLGNSHTCAVVTGALWCRGSNKYGQIGNGESGDPALVFTRVIANGVTAVSAGNTHTCAVVSGALWCWGSNEYGQIGTGESGGYGNKVLRPTQIIASGVTAVSSGYVHTCAVIGGGLQCWGANDSGQVGHGKVDANVLTPTQVIGSGVTAVSAGHAHTCAVVKGALQCWGDNNSGAFGSRVAGNIIPNPAQMIAGGVTKVWAGYGRTCVLVNGALRCRGAEDSPKPTCFFAVSSIRCRGDGINSVLKNLTAFRPFNSNDGDLDENDLLRNSCEGELPSFALRVVESLQVDSAAFAKCRVWPADRSKTIVVLAFFKTGDLSASSETSGDLDVLVVKTGSGDALHRLTQKSALGSNPGAIAIDTANYELARGVRAFGVRTSYATASSDTLYEHRATETINLYLPQGNSLKEILHNLIVNDAEIGEYGIRYEEPAEGFVCGYGTIVTRTLATAKTNSHGYADLVLNERKIDRQQFLAKGSCDRVEDTLSSSRQYLLRFDGNNYVIPAQELHFAASEKAQQPRPHK